MEARRELDRQELMHQKRVALETNKIIKEQQEKERMSVKESPPTAHTNQARHGRLSQPYACCYGNKQKNIFIYLHILKSVDLTTGHNIHQSGLLNCRMRNHHVMNSLEICHLILFKKCYVAFK